MSMMPITIILMVIGGFFSIGGVFFYKSKKLPYCLFIIGTLFGALALLVETRDYLMDSIRIHLNFYSLSRKNFLRFFVAALAGLGLAACGGQKNLETASSPTLAITATITPTPILTRTSTVTPEPTVAFTPTATLQFLLTPTYRRTHVSSFTPVRTATATLTPLPTPTSLFPVLLDYPSSWATPAPIALPPESARAYSLREWNEEFAVSLIHELEQYACVADVLGAFGMRGGLPEVQKPFRLVIWEAISHSPQTQIQEALEWRLAIANALIGSHESDLWILDIIQRGLNEGRFTLQTLGEYLLLFGFQSIIYSQNDRGENAQPVANLFGEGQDAYIVQITTQRFWSGDGMFIAISPDRVDGLYRVEMIYSDWAFEYGDDSIFTIGDHTKNGIPEVVLYIGGHSGNMCQGDVFIFEWSQDGWSELTGGKMHLSNCQNEWGYQKADENGFATIYAHDLYNGRLYYFRWNGSIYEIFKREYPARDPLSLSNMMGDGAFALEQEVIENALPLSPEDFSQYSSLGPAYEDYLRFQLGFLAALQSRPSEAHTILESLVLSPTQPYYTVVPQAGRAFLQNYHSDADIYRACQDALYIVENALASYRDENGKLQFEDALRVLGYDPFFSNEGFYLCSLRASFPLLVSTLPAGERLGNPILRLQQAGVSTRHSAELDIDGDGDHDWVVISETPMGSRGWPRLDVWAVLNTPPVYKTQYLGFLYLSEPALFRVQAIFPTDLAEPVLIIQMGGELWVFHTSAGEFEGILHEEYVEQFNISRKSKTVDIELKYMLSSYRNFFWRVYRWDGQTKDLVSVSWLKEMIFDEQQPARVIPILQGILLKLKDADETAEFPRSEYRYWLGLAYELNGDTIHAIETYWQIWHDYPNSPYALIARAKLVPIPVP